MIRCFSSITLVLLISQASFGFEVYQGKVRSLAMNKGKVFARVHSSEVNSEMQSETFRICPRRGESFTEHQEFYNGSVQVLQEAFRSGKSLEVAYFSGSKSKFFAESKPGFCLSSVPTFVE